MPDRTSQTYFRKSSLGGKHLWVTASFRMQKSRRRGGNRSTERGVKRGQEVASLGFVPPVKYLEFMLTLGLMKLYFFKCQLSVHYPLEIGAVVRYCWILGLLYLYVEGEATKNHVTTLIIPHTIHHFSINRQTHLFVSLNYLVMTVSPAIAILIMYIVTWTSRAPT